MKALAERDKLITQHYLAGRKLIDIARLFGWNSPGYVRLIAKRNGAPPRKNGRPVKALAARDKLIAQHYIAGRKLTEIMLLFGLRSPGHVRIIARRTGAPPRKNGRPPHDPD